MHIAQTLDNVQSRTNMKQFAYTCKRFQSICVLKEPEQRHFGMKMGALKWFQSGCMNGVFKMTTS